MVWFEFGDLDAVVEGMKGNFGTSPSFALIGLRVLQNVMLGMTMGDGVIKAGPAKKDPVVSDGVFRETASGVLMLRPSGKRDKFPNNPAWNLGKTPKSSPSSPLLFARLRSIGLGFLSIDFLPVMFRLIFFVVSIVFAIAGDSFNCGELVLSIVSGETELGLEFGLDPFTLPDFRFLFRIGTGELLGEVVDFGDDAEDLGEVHRFKGFSPAPICGNGRTFDNASHFGRPSSFNKSSLCTNEVFSCSFTFVPEDCSTPDPIRLSPIPPWAARFPIILIIIMAAVAAAFGS